MKSSDSLAWAVLGELICKAASCSCREHSLCWVQRASEVAQVIKSPPANAGDSKDTGLIPGSGRFPAVRNGNPLQYSCLENSMDRRAWWATVHGVTKCRMRLDTHARPGCSRNGNGLGMRPPGIKALWPSSCVPYTSACLKCEVLVQLTLKSFCIFNILLLNITGKKAPITTSLKFMKAWRLVNTSKKWSFPNHKNALS